MESSTTDLATALELFQNHDPTSHWAACSLFSIAPVDSVATPPAPRVKRGRIYSLTVCFALVLVTAFFFVNPDCPRVLARVYVLVFQYLVLCAAEKILYILMWLYYTVASVALLVAEYHPTYLF
ncbi:hypothetical protein FRC08_012884 [Ceratobasidium sp. 394]|nr:hypothetical protein FRC08_012884 [Ceratobasidium sp. 394]